MARFPVLPQRKWTRPAAAHLARRAGFCPTPDEVDDLASLSHGEAVDLVIRPPENAARHDTPDWFQDPAAKSRFPKGYTWQELRALPKEERDELNRNFRKENRKRMDQTRSWWVNRMATSPHPYEEKLALFWHGHFATAFQKVRHAPALLEQNMMFREKGRGSLADLLEAVSADPAMLKYLDNYRSRRKKPNENYARELLELFSLGEGNYTEDDVREAARAFTGWTLKRTTYDFTFNPRQHDSDIKQFMGESGPFDGRDIIDRITDHPRAAEFLTEKLWKFYASDIVNERVVGDVAHDFRKSNHSISIALRTLFLHEDFYHPKVVRGKIKSPVELSVGLIKTLQPSDVPLKQVQRACQTMGQTLFDPPSVKGWDGGAAWITASSLALRYSLAERLIRRKNSFVESTLLPDTQCTREEARDRLLDVFYSSALREQDRMKFDKVLADLPPPPEWQRQHYIKAMNHLVQQPQYQLC